MNLAKISSESKRPVFTLGVMGYNQRQATLVGVHWAFFGAATIAIATRSFVRIKLRPGSLAWDDWTMLLAYGLALGAGVVETLMVENGVGRRMETVDPRNIPEVAKLTMINSILNLLGTMFVKISVCIFLHRMFSLANRTVKWLVLINLAILVPVTVGIIITDLVQCIPLDGYWNNDPLAKCIPQKTIGILLKTASSVGVVTDFITAAIPIAVISMLRIPRNEKYALSALLGLGFFTAGASIAKTVVINWAPVDYTWDNSRVGYWAAIEHQCGIIVGCLPSSRPILQYLRRRPESGSTPAAQPHALGTSGETMNKQRAADSVARLLHDSGPDMHIWKMTQAEVSHEARGTASAFDDAGDSRWV